MEKNRGLDIESANRKAVEKILTAEPVLIDIRPAIEALPRMTKDTFLHAGPPVEWERMRAPMREALCGAIVYEELAENKEAAIKLAEAGEVKIAPCHHYDAVVGMAGVISSSMPLFVVENKPHGNFSFSAMKEAPFPRNLSYGVFNDDILQKLRWTTKTLGPGFKAAVKESGGIDLKSLIARALHMGDDCHVRLIATNLLFLREIVVNLFKAGVEKNLIRQVTGHLANDDNFAVNVVMAACKGALDSGHRIEDSTVVTAMARNGTEFGIRVSGLGDQWFTAPSPFVKGVYFPGYGPEDANPDTGDSAITETMGLGAFVMATAPAVVQQTGETAKDAAEYTKEMFEITVTKNSSYTIPHLNFIGTPTCIDVIKVVETGIAPIINTGINHKKEGFGLIGMGMTRAPMECFVKAFKAMKSKLE